MTRLKAVIETADALADGSLAPWEPCCGLCTNLSTITEMDCDNLVHTISQDWPEFSGDAEFPVPHPELPPYDGYRHGLYDGHWSGKYGATRRRLAKFIADWCREHPESAVALLPLED